LLAPFLCFAELPPQFTIKGKEQEDEAKINGKGE